MDPPGCSVFGLLVGRSCDIDPPSSAKNVIELSGVKLRCRLDLFSSEFVSPPTSVGNETSCVGGLFLDGPRLGCRSVCPSGHLGNGRGDPVRPLRCPKFFLHFTCYRNGCFIPVRGKLVYTPNLIFVVPRDVAETYGGRAVTAAWGEGMARHATLIGMGPGSAIPGPPPRITNWLLTWSLGLTWLPPKCYRGCPSGVVSRA
ncbi:hypothetical protein B296_00028311 [Ensete ventricosum]|uniref:Uncharacterized protein n=1 Tax=Ensete ventricosum TaxID=4639 RepID=A0A426Y7G5_ENSVE|nr:hypothetical protein B296_00028311 [Ensete ventricosum]